MRQLDDASDLSLEQLRLEIARILAAGVLRLRKRRTLAAGADVPKNSQNSSAERLEVPGDTVLSVTHGLTNPRVPSTRRKPC
jgi:hypothetical protein